MEAQLSRLRVNPKVVIHMVAAVAAMLASSPAFASGVTVISSCPGEQHIPVKFKIDCSHLRDRATKTLCGTFAENQACKVFPTYLKITGIDVERLCPTVSYILYDRDNWSYREAGGVSFKCRVDELAEYALRSNSKSPIGPHEFHEILHQYQMAQKTLALITAFHPLFSSTILEAERVLGERKAYELGIRRLKREITRIQTSLNKRTIKKTDTCRMAQTVIEERLYLEHRRNIYKMYRTLANATGGDPNVQMSVMLNDVSGGTAGQFLLEHGCRKFQED